MAKKKANTSVEQLKAELQQIQGNRKTLTAKDVLEYAKKNKSSEVWKRYDAAGLWNDKVAAEKARLSFGNTLIQRYKVKIIGHDTQTHKVRGLVSLPSDRKQGGGYRVRADVLTDEERLAEMRELAASDIETLINRYADILDSESIQRLREVVAEISSAATLG